MDECRRHELQEILERVINSEFVYFQPPESMVMSYPCIVYELSRIDAAHADNMTYLYRKCYSVTIIDGDPDSEIPNRMFGLPMCKFDRFYTADNLNHWVFLLYF